MVFSHSENTDVIVYASGQKTSGKEEMKRFKELKATALDLVCLFK